jgi:hypothetical protein
MSKTSSQTHLIDTLPTSYLLVNVADITTGDSTDNFCLGLLLSDLDLLGVKYGPARIDDNIVIFRGPREQVEAKAYFLRKKNVRISVCKELPRKRPAKAVTDQKNRTLDEF